MENGTITVRADGHKVKFSEHRIGVNVPGTFIGLPNYRQQDTYSCGYNAALTVAHYYDPSIEASAMLRAVRPDPDGGTQRKQIINGLGQFGIKAELHKDLTIMDLRRYTKRGIPVIISVWADGWASDHWCCIRGFTLWRVYLTNHYNMPIDQFLREWTWKPNPTRNTTSYGIVCIA